VKDDMKRVCKQCGKSFELSDSEIAFYKSRNLNLPKRCKACRQANKQGKLVQEGVNCDVQKQEQEQDSAGRENGKVGKWAYAVIAVSILLLFGLTRISDRFFLPDDAGQTASAEDESADTAVSLQDEEDDAQQYVFRNSELLNDHFEKHGKEMGFSSAEDYQAAANAVVNDPNALHKTEKEDGDDVYYLEATNEFVIVSPDGHIRTYFYPDAGIDYYNRQ